jgi:hypothetical protein
MTGSNAVSGATIWDGDVVLVKLLEGKRPDATAGVLAELRRRGHVNRWPGGQPETPGVRLRGDWAPGIRS